MYNIRVNGKFDYKVENKGDKLLINDEKIDADIQKQGLWAYHIIHNMSSVNAEVVSFDREAKTAEIIVNGTIYTVSAKDQYDVLLDKLGLSSLTNTRISEVKAPMPGLVLKVFVREGSVVKKGDNLFILEAMKMENIIKSPADVIVKTIKIKPGDKVEKGQVLIRF